MLNRDELMRMTERKMENGGSYTYRDLPADRIGSQRRQTASDAGTDEVNDTQTASYEMLLISWLAERPDLCETVFGYIKPEEFNMKSCRLLAEAIHKHMGDFEPAAFLNSPELGEEERRNAAKMFAEPDRSGSILNMNQAEIEKGLTEAIRAIRSVHIDREMSACGNDMIKFQNLLRDKNALRDFKVRL